MTTSLGKHLHTVNSKNFFDSTDSRGEYEEITTENTIDIYMYPTNKNIVFQIKQQVSSNSGWALTPEQVFMELNYKEVEALHQKLGEFIAEKTRQQQLKDQQKQNREH